MLKNDMILSLPKCNTLIISSKKQPLTLNVDIDGTIIPNLSTTKILGVNFDNAMSWDEHVKAIRNKITKNLYLLQQIKSFLPVNARKLFVNSYILPYIDYCCVKWGNCSITLVHSLEKTTKNICQIKESFSFKTRMSGTVKCRPTVAY